MAGFFSFEDLLGGAFPGGGGGSHHFRQQSSEDEEEVDTTAYYKLLNCDKKATQDELKKAYRAMARKLHPDRHPNEKDLYQKKFQELQKAFETLKDPHKRELYDKYGEKGVKRGHAPFKGGMGGLFEEMFSNSRSKKESGPKKSPKIQRVMHITLEDSYGGSLKQLKIGKHVAKGNKKSSKCGKCNGNGQITVTQRRGPMIFQQTKNCHQCNGMGYKLATKEVELDINVPIGVKDGENYTIQGVGHEYPDHEPGDVIIQFRIKKHSTFTRQGADLGMTHKLSLREALCGYKLRVLHVSGKNLVITSQNDNEIVQPGSLKRIYNMGMPQRYAPHIKGHLYIVMEVEFPLNKSINNKTTQAFKRILPKVLPDKYKNECGIDVDGDDEVKENINGSKSKKKSGKKNSNKKKNNASDFGANLFGGLNKKKSSKKKMDLDNDDDDNNNNNNNIDDDEILYGECCEDNPKATPASATHEYDDEDAQEGVQCKQM